MTKGLHPRQAAILAFVRKYKAEHGYSPGIREIADGIDASSSGTYVHILQLCANGYMTRGPGMARSYNVVRK